MDVPREDTATADGAEAEARYEHLALARGDVLEALADRILASGVAVDVVAGPAVGVAPIRLPLPGSADTFVLGRVALTTCEVRLDGVHGAGVAPGRALRAALAAAVCDAEAERGGPLAGEVARLAAEAWAARRAALRAEAEGVAATRLDLDP